MGSLLSRTPHEAVLAAIVILLALGLSVGTRGFLTVENLVDVLVASSFTGILAAGLLVVLVSGGIDVSFSATATVAQYVTGLAILETGTGWAEAFVISAAAGLLLGLGNALLIHWLRASPIIVTIATLNLYFGSLMAVTSGTWLYGFPTWFADGLTLAVVPLGDDRSVTLSLQVVALLGTWAFTYVLLQHLPVGRALYAMGSSQESARRMGLRLLGLHLVAYGYMGLTAGIAGLTQAQLVQTIAPNAFVGRELAVLAAVVLGGASLTGGVGTMAGTVLGVLFVALLQNGLTLLAVSSYAHTLIIGLVIVASVSVNALRQRRAVPA
jgi:simple sugar transport system permease protein